MKLQTQAIHSGHAIDLATGAISPPIHLSTTFERDPDGSYPRGYAYSRADSPNREALQTTLATLEGGQVAAAFASGSAATMTVLQALTTGDHVIAPLDIYFGIREMLLDIFVPWGLAVSFVDMRDPCAVEQAVRPETKLVMAESPSNPLLQVTDIQAVADIAHAAGAWLMVDNTIATPIFQRPLELGADLVVHATTKYLNGHHDVLGGVVVARESSPFWERIAMIHHIGGAVQSPFDCWMIQRGLQTLPYRMQAMADNAMHVAHFLEQHAQVERVLYPGLESHDDHKLATRQMDGYGALMSFLVRGDEAKTIAVAANVNLIVRATSFGGPHTQIEHRASIEHDETTTPRNLLRLAVGLEHPDDIIADLEQALA